MGRLVWIPFLVTLCLQAGATQESGAREPFPSFRQVDQAKVDNAVRLGIAYLKGANARHRDRIDYGDKFPKMADCELVLWTYLHSGAVSESDPEFQQLLKDMLERKLEYTYAVSLQAMVLEELDRVKYQRRIWQCAQFLVDNQGPEGSWQYGEPTPFADTPPAIPTSSSPKKPMPGAPDAPRVKPPVKLKVRVEKKREGRDGDNSNSQYAVLGLRACYDAGIQFPPAVIDKAIDWYRKTQRQDNGGAPVKVFEGPPSVEPEDGAKRKTTAAAAASASAEPRGWSYGQKREAHGSMTAGSTGSLVILLYIKDGDGGKAKSWKGDKNVLEGLAWIAKNFSVTSNPGVDRYGEGRDSRTYLCYYLYALERLGMLYGTERFGAHLWYPEGAAVLLETQTPDGSWPNEKVWASAVQNTCFAILFLKRGTRPLNDVASVDRFIPK